MIGRLLARPRLWAYRWMKRGEFGPIVRVQGRNCVDLDGVEELAGRRFDRDQLARAGVPIMQHEVTDGAEAQSDTAA
jgi:hypothetical protein